MRRDCDDSGNLNFDFLVGMMVFLLAFMYVINSIPAIFMPYETNMVDLNSVTYRTSCILAEDPGWYTDTVNTFSFSDWESRPDPAADVTRIGLAVDKKSPNVLALDKIEALKGIPYGTSRDKLGLANTMVYDYGLTIDKLTAAGTVQLLNVTGNPGSGNVESLERVVRIREGEGLLINPNGMVYQNSLNINKSPRLEGNITVRLVNRPHDWAMFKNNLVVSYYTGNKTTSTLVNISDYNSHYYYIYKNYNFVANPATEGCLKSDTVDIIFNASLIQQSFMGTTNLTNINVRALGCIPDALSGDVVLYYSPDNQYFRYFDSLGIMRLEVWQA